MTTVSRHTYLSWLRRGVGGALMAPGDATTMPMRPALDLSVSLASGSAPDDLMPDASAAVAGLTLAGPGDAVGLGPDAVLRSDPAPGTPDMFPNMVPTVEFRLPDLPWMFSPAAPDAQGRLTPWLALVCLEDETEGRLDVDGNTPVPVLTVTPPEGVAMAGHDGVLPDPEQAWAWAHVQLTGFDPARQDVGDFVDARPDRVLSRLICPRNLLPRRRYLCAVVPLFEAGRRAALGEDPGDATGLAWRADDSGPLRLPALHHWRFATTRRGDFEALARRLQPTALSAPIGRRAIDVQHPGFDGPKIGQIVRPPVIGDSGAARNLPFPVVHSATPTTILLGGALRPAGQEAAPPADAGLAAALRDVLTGRDAPGSPATIRPPRYGCWYPATAGDPRWVADIAEDVRRRIAAGLGAAIVRDRQDAFMDEAWAQYGPLEQINAVLDGARLSRAAGRRLFADHLEIAAQVCGRTDAPPERVLDTLAPVLSRLRWGPRGPALGTAFEGTDTGPPGPALRRRMRTAPPGGYRAALARHRAGLRRPPAGLRGRDLPGPMAEAVARASATLAPVLQAPGSFPAPGSPHWPSINAALCDGLRPDATQRRRGHARLGAAVPAAIPGDDPLHPVIAGPDFPQPMAPVLSARSQEWLLPGADAVPQNAVSLLEPDPAFIEAVMAGLNHAMIDEMLWRGYPTHRRATPFRVFWDRRGGRPGTDIAPMSDWSGPLGSHGDGAATPGLMLLMRGDLLRRFPRTLIYALPALDGSTPPRVDPAAAPRLPLFSGRLGTDIGLVAFDLDAATAMAGAGWFFVVEGPPTEPGFGLDATLDFDQGDFGRDMAAVSAQGGYDWDPIYWGDLLADTGDAGARRAALDALRHVPLAPGNPSLGGFAANGLTWGASSAHMAAILRQRPVRVAFHADALIGGGS